LRQVGDLFELNVKLRCQNVNIQNNRLNRMCDTFFNVSKIWL